MCDTVLSLPDLLQAPQRGRSQTPQGTPLLPAQPRPQSHGACPQETGRPSWSPRGGIWDNHRVLLAGGGGEGLHWGLEATPPVKARLGCGGSEQGEERGGEPALVGTIDRAVHLPQPPTPLPGLPRTHSHTHVHLSHL